jgi:hypothetical protein
MTQLGKVTTVTCLSKPSMTGASFGRTFLRSHFFLSAMPVSLRGCPVRLSVAAQGGSLA